MTRQVKWKYISGTVQPRSISQHGSNLLAIRSFSIKCDVSHIKTSFDHDSINTFPMPPLVEEFERIFRENSPVQKLNVKISCSLSPTCNCVVLALVCIYLFACKSRGWADLARTWGLDVWCCVTGRFLTKLLWGLAKVLFARTWDRPTCAGTCGRFDDVISRLKHDFSLSCEIVL